MRGRATFVALIAVFGTVLVVDTARGAHVACGAVLDESTTLDGDVGPCSGRGITIAANNVTLNLNNFRVFGVEGSTGEGEGIFFDAVEGSTVKNGTVELFDVGVRIVGGSDNTVKKLTVQENIGRTLLGEGIQIDQSSNNVVKKNAVVHNGPFGGITLLNGGSGNEIRSNTVTDNNIKHPTAAINEDIGIRVENGVTETVISKNTVEGSGLEGISIFAGSTNNEVLKNTVESNGAHDQPHRKGDGIRIFGDNNRVKRNTATGNAANGIGVNSTATDNTLQKNKAFGNAVHDNTKFDLSDETPACDNNLWRNNGFDTASQECIQ